MADIREQDLALKTTIADTDWIRLVTPTGNHKMTVGQFKDLIGFTALQQEVVSLQNPVVYEQSNSALNQILNPTLNDWHVVNGFNIQLPPGNYLIEFQTSVQASMSGTGIAQPMVQLRTNVPTNTMVGYALLGNTISTSNTSSWVSVSGSFYYNQPTATSVLTMMIRLASVSGSPTITGLYARTNFPANSGFIRAIKIS